MSLSVVCQDLWPPPIPFSSQPSLQSFAILASKNYVKLSGGPDQIVIVASMWQGQSGTTDIEKVGHSCPSEDHHLPAH